MWLALFLGSLHYYLECRVPSVRMISCIPESNNGMDEDFLIILSEWLHRLHCPTQDRELGGVPKVFRLI